MKIDILTLFPEMFAPLKESIIKRAVEDGKIEINITNIRDFANPPHYRCDDMPFGGGAGMVMMCEPLFKAIESVKQENSKIFYMSPRGKVLNYNLSKEYASKECNYIIICGHYEGIDERIIEEYNVKEISIGDYVLTGGELACQVFMDSVIRLLPGALSEGSLDEESHTNQLLEYPQYTKPYDFRGRKVPDILLSGHHKNIADYRKQESIRITKKFRPDLIDKQN